MQIEDGFIIKFTTYILGSVTAILSGLYWYIWKGDRKRIKSLEEKIGAVVSKHEVELIVSKTEDKFRSEHKALSEKIESVHAEIRLNKIEIREDIRDLREVLTSGYSGIDRRRK